MSLESKIDTARQLIDDSGVLGPFMPASQRAALRSNLGAECEEREYFADLLIELAAKIEAMPVTYEQDGKGDNAVIHLHYFHGGADFWITEKDVTGGVEQAFGLAQLPECYPEMGYISIREITHAGVELDLYWKNKTVGEVKREQGI